MKRSTLLAALLAALLFTALLPAPAAKADVSVSFSFFHDTLVPYGRWVTAGSYGQVWYPLGVHSGWQPYTVGHWGWGDYGWTWVSYDPWGDWTYRYGTWTYQLPWGWVWVPGYTWGPAWVTWSYTNDYIGWAPIPPTFSFSVTGYFGSPVVVNRSWYCFVPRQRFVTAGNVYNVRVPVHQNQVILERSRKVTRFPVSGGVVRNEGLALRNVERASAARVQRVNTRRMRAAPARIDTARASNRKISVAAPARTRSEQSGRVERSPVEKSQPERSRVDSRRVERSRPRSEVRREKAARPERAVRPPNTRRQPEPAPAPDVRRAPDSRSSSKREVSRPSEPQARKARPADSKVVKRPARPSKPRPEARVSRDSSSREKPRADRVSASRVRAPASEGSRASAARKPAPETTSQKRTPKPKNKPRPESTGQRGRP